MKFWDGIGWIGLDWIVWMDGWIYWFDRRRLMVGVGIEHAQYLRLCTQGTNI
jgi:hypothetical protein